MAYIVIPKIMRWWESAVDIFAEATAGQKEVPSDWMSATGLRALIQDDPALLWLKYHGTNFGFQEDAKEFSFLEWIGNKGRAFEDKWTREVAPEAKQGLDQDVDVRRVQGLLKTLELMDRKIPVITKAALWWAPERIYGSSDLICLTSWLYERFPHLKPAQAAPDHYVVLDCKFSTKLDQSDHKTDLACNAAQIRIYSYMLGHLQGHMPDHAYLVTRDRPFDPLPVAVDHDLDGPLDPHLACLRDLHIHIKQDGAQYVPWKDAIVAANFANEKDDPWHGAKKRIAREFIPGGALELLPHIGRKQAEELKAMGYKSVEHLLAHDPDRLPLEKLHGIGTKTAPRIRAVLEANRSGAASSVNAVLLPSKRDVELYVDYEYFTNINVDFEKEFPEMEGCEMVFMVGVGWEESGKWCYTQFVAAREDHESESTMFQEFLSFLVDRGVFEAGQSAALYHWSNAEVWQSKHAAERHGLERLASLPWVDIQKPFHEGPIALPGAWEFGLKSVAAAVGSYSPEHRVDWPKELGAGLAAMVMGWAMYQQSKPLVDTCEMDMISQYLEIDCKAMWQVLRWLRAAAVDRPMAGGWYSGLKRQKTPKRKPPRTRGPSKGRKGRRRSFVGEDACGWYRQAVLILAYS